MRNVKNLVLVGIFVCVALAGIGAAGVPEPSGEQKYPTALELLERYAATQDKLQSYIIKSEIQNYEVSSTAPGCITYVSGREAGGASAEVRFDGRR